jgi:cell division septum initiation protein DivIVA
MNEILDLLEQCVHSFLDEMSALRRENDQLQRDMTEKTGHLAEENASLKEAFAREKAARETAAERINALLQRLTDRMSE